MSYPMKSTGVGKKPFVLRWFPSDSSGNYYEPGFDPKADHDCTEILRNFVDGPIGVAGTVLRKRLSTSALSAEWWRYQSRTFLDGEIDMPVTAEDFRGIEAQQDARAAVIQRFAQFNHHDNACRPELEWHKGQPQPRVEQIGGPDGVD